MKNNFPTHKPKDVEFIQQKNKTDCGVACIAMLLHCLYDPIKKLFTEYKKNIRGLYPEEIFDILEDIGYKSTELSILPKNSNALVAIQWKDESLSGHYIVWSNKRAKFLDPLNGIFDLEELNKVAYIEKIWKIYKTHDKQVKSKK